MSMTMTTRIIRITNEGWLEWARVAFVAVILVLVWARVVPRVSGIDILALIGVLIGGYPIFKEAIADLLERRMTMELSMTIALVAASVIGEFFTALLITVFVLIAEILEGMTVGRGRRAIRELLDLLPQTAEVRSTGQVAARSLSEVAVGDVVLVRPGGRIPVDGVVAERALLCRPVDNHGRVHAGGEDLGHACLRGNHQPIGRTGNPRRKDRPRHSLWTDHRGGRARRALPGADSAYGGSSGRLSGLFRLGLCGADVSDYA